MRVLRYVWAALAVCACNAGDGTVPGAPSTSSAPPPPPAADLALAADLPAQCSGPEIFRIARPITSAEPARGHYPYGFRFKPPASPASPVLVYLPGGPGMTSTDAPPELLPPSWGYLLTDPRGVGCNTLAALPDDAVSGLFFRTDEIANDVVAAIADRHLQEYVLYGISYGTVLGAHVASKLATRGPEPRAIVFEGVVGAPLGEANTSARPGSSCGTRSAPRCPATSSTSSTRARRLTASRPRGGRARSDRSSSAARTSTRSSSTRSPASTRSRIRRSRRSGRTRTRRC